MAFSFNLAEEEVPIRAGNLLLLSRTPSTPASLLLFRNGLLMSRKFSDYTIDGRQITPNPPPADDDLFLAYFRW